MRPLVLIVFVLLILMSPFLLSSVYVDTRGETIQGKVRGKREDVTVHYSSWRRVSAVTVQYQPPDGYVTGFFTVDLPPEEYDQLHVGQPVPLHYLRQENLPKLQLFRILDSLHALSRVRLQSRHIFSGLADDFTPRVRSAVIAIACVAILLLGWRTLRLPHFASVAVLTAVAAGFIWSYEDLPRPAPQPAGAIQSMIACVKTINRIDRLLEGDRQRGTIANQSIDVVALEFVPEARSESVVAVDLIDAGSVSGLKTGLNVPVVYATEQPRSAYINGARRGFFKANLFGLAEEGVIWVVFIGVALAAIALFNRLTARKT